jgi:hypothetical protein
MAAPRRPDFTFAKSGVLVNAVHKIATSECKSSKPPMFENPQMSRNKKPLLRRGTSSMSRSYVKSDEVHADYDEAVISGGAFSHSRRRASVRRRLPWQG